MHFFLDALRVKYTCTVIRQIGPCINIYIRFCKSIPYSKQSAQITISTQGYSRKKYLGEKTAGDIFFYGWLDGTFSSYMGHCCLTDQHPPPPTSQGIYSGIALTYVGITSCEPCRFHCSACDSTSSDNTRNNCTIQSIFLIVIIPSKK